MSRLSLGPSSHPSPGDRERVNYSRTTISCHATSRLHGSLSLAPLAVQRTGFLFSWSLAVDAVGFCSCIFAYLACFFLSPYNTTATSRCFRHIIVSCLAMTLVYISHFSLSTKHIAIDFISHKYYPPRAMSNDRCGWKKTNYNVSPSSCLS